MRARRVVRHRFSRNFLRQATFVAAEQAANVVQCIESKATSKESFDLQALFYAFTIDVFSLVAFGVDLKSIGRTDAHPFAKAFDRVQELCNNRYVYIGCTPAPSSMLLAGCIVLMSNAWQSFSTRWRCGIASSLY